MYCENCGKKIQKDQDYCLGCGKAINKFKLGYKSKILAGVLAILFGRFGIHNFYLGFTSKAITQLVLTLVGYVLTLILIGYILLAIVYIWTFIEGIMILVGSINIDSEGKELI